MKDQEKIFLWLKLTCARGLGRRRIRRLWEHYKDIKLIFGASEQELREVCGAPRGIGYELANNQYDEFAKKEIERCEELGVELVSLDSPIYPENLLQIPDPPPIFYLKGTLEKEDKKAVAVVGSRNHNEYGEVMAKKIGSGLAKFGITVVSGLARGIDSISQRSALEAGGRSIAVLGSGIDVIYPPEMKGLYEEIAQQGAIITEYPFGTPPHRENFPERNRIISGLSLAVVVVQATSPKSGSLITAKLALEQGRMVYAVPGNAGTVWSRQTNQLIKQGAGLVESAEDIVLDLFPTMAFKPEQLGPLFAQQKEKEQSLTDAEEKIYSLIPEPEEGSIELDHLIRKSGLSSSLVQAVLIELELAGLVEKLAGGKWRKKQPLA